MREQRLIAKTVLRKCLSSTMIVLCNFIKIHGVNRMGRFYWVAFVALLFGCFPAHCEDVSSEQQAERERLLARISQAFDDYERRPRRVFVTENGARSRINEYAEKCLGEVLKIGNWDYPAEAKKNHLHGNVVASFDVLPTGEVQDIRIEKSSGHPVLDDAIRRAIKYAAPFSPFPPKVRERADVLTITKVFSFTRR